MQYLDLDTHSVSSCMRLTYN